MSLTRHISAEEAAALISDESVITVSSSSGMGCPDVVLAAIGERFTNSGSPARLTSIHPIAAGDMYGVKGIDHIALPGLLSKVIAGSYPSGPSSATPPAIWQMITGNEIPAWNIPSGILFDMHREAAAHRPGVLTKTGMDTFVDPNRQGGAMNEKAKDISLVERTQFAGDEWLFFPSIVPDVAIIRATTADERGNLSYEHEGAYLGPLEQALAVRNNGGIVIAQVKRRVTSGSIKPKDVRVPGVLVDYVVVAPDQTQTTQTTYDQAISGEMTRPLEEFSLMENGPSKVIARRVAQELSDGQAVNLGFGISANVPRIFLEEKRHGEVTWLLEQGAVGGVPLLEFQFGCASNAEAIMPSPQQFTYFQGGGFDVTLMSFLQIGADGSVNVSLLPARPHVTAGCGGFIDITSHAKRVVFSGFYNAGAQLSLKNGELKILREGKAKKIVNEVTHVTFSGKRAIEQGQQVMYVTERCVLELTTDGLVVTEIAPGIDLHRDILQQSETPLLISPNLKVMDRSLFVEGAENE
ncbi:CoA-transferase [Enterobacter asburiae]|nr:CoA-transferase [Enterobacter asburiae]